MMYFSPNKDVVTIEEMDFSVYLSDQQIQERISAIADDISQEYIDKNPIFLVVLNGAFRFGADLFNRMDFACEIQFIRVKSYEKMKSTKNITIKGIEEVRLKDRHVIIVEDIVDSGLTMHRLIPMLEELGPKSTAIATLLTKSDALEHDVDIKYVGFDIPDRFVVGYGLDYDEMGRNLSHIYQLIDIIE